MDYINEQLKNANIPIVCSYKTMDHIKPKQILKESKNGKVIMLPCIVTHHDDTLSVNHHVLLAFQNGKYVIHDINGNPDGEQILEAILLQLMSDQNNAIAYYGENTYIPYQQSNQ